MIRGLKWAGAFAVVLVVVFIVTPQDKVDRAHESWLRLTGSPGIACLDYERRQLKDPESAKLLSTVGEGSNTTIRYKAKNSYGAFVSSDARCTTFDGAVNVEITTLDRENARNEVLLNEMKRDNACLDRQSRLMSNGAGAVDATAQVRQTDGCSHYRGIP